MAAAHWAVWACLAFFVVVAVGGGFHVGRAGLRFWRDFKRASRVLGAGAAALGTRAEEASRKAAAASTAAERLAESNARLQRSLAYARIVADAAGDARATLTGLQGSVPRK